jgi:hypothetical protein
MENTTNEILDSNFLSSTPRRRKLLPWWIKTFCWIFMVLGVVACLGAGFGLFGFTFQLAIYGLKSYDPMSLTGMALIAIFLLKGVAGYALWSEKDWAIMVSQIDGVIGILVCLLVMILPRSSESGFSFYFNFELLLLIPYLIKITKIKESWIQAAGVSESGI